MRVDFVSLFPEFIEQALSFSIMARAAGSGAAEFRTSNPRDFATDKHRTVDDTSYGGGPGMVMMPTPIEAAVTFLSPAEGAAIVLCDAAGERFTQSVARELAQVEHLVFICGHYEGVDERVRTTIANRCFTVGDYVLTGGELPALVMADAVVRLLPGVLGDPASHEDDSHTDGLLGFPLYTKPAVFRGETVPEVLTSGNHAAIARWRRQQSLLRTRQWRPDLFSSADFSSVDVNLLSE